MKEYWWDCLGGQRFEFESREVNRPWRTDCLHHLISQRGCAVLSLTNNAATLGGAGSGGPCRRVEWRTGPSKSRAKEQEEEEANQPGMAVALYDSRLVASQLSPRSDFGGNPSRRNSINMLLHSSTNCLYFSSSVDTLRPFPSSSHPSSLRNGSHSSRPSSCRQRPREDLRQLRASLYRSAAR